MGHAEYLKKLLAPLHFYELDCGFGAAELETLGQALDGALTAGSELERESQLPTAEGWGIESWERLLPYRPEAVGAKDRREAAAALIGMERDAYTLAAMSRAVSGSGIWAEVYEKPGRRVEIRFPGTRGIPENIEALKARIEEILPCHLETEYWYSYLLWRELEGYFSSWAELESVTGSWGALEKYMEA